ncbi:C-GCAxxG-C-C family (seleno)protein [Chakrabartyella piscis]|uniref:C-GCAxxG-C-C family (seleno)protein n=1 Tax=Chakrabartyella piscis TaxID=2918914 RepID=UPI002958ACEE|nr:C-GCAxxG-C-C family (seleno)protein [Chakrabartyella piscis]
MKKHTLEYLNQGESCSRSILLGAAKTYGFTLSKSTLDSCNAIQAGFCIGGTCSAIVGAVMVLGMLFPEKDAQQKSLLLFYEIQSRWHCLECCKLTLQFETCQDFICELCDILEEIIALKT